MKGFQQTIFKTILDNYEKFYVHLMPHTNLIIGSRGLIGDEKQNGIVLVFSSYSYDKLNIDDNSIAVNMKFAGSWESLYIPVECISAIFNDPMKPEFMFSFKPQNAASRAAKVQPDSQSESEETADGDAPAKDNVIQFHPKK